MTTGSGKDNQFSSTLDTDSRRCLKVENDPWLPLESNHPPVDENSTMTSATSSSILPVPQNPLYQMIDSERYIQSLEQKLSKLTKKRGKEPTSRDIINSLAVFHEDQMRHYINDSTNDSSLTSGHAVMALDDTSVQSSFLQRRLFPERQPLNAEEVAELLKEDTMADRFENVAIDSKTDRSDPNLAADADRTVSCLCPDTRTKGSSDSDKTETLLTPGASHAQTCGPSPPGSAQSTSVSEVTVNTQGESSITNEENWADFDQMKDTTRSTSDS